MHTDQFTYIHIMHTHSHTHINWNIRIHKHTRTSTQIHIHTCMHRLHSTYIHTNINIHIRTCRPVFTYTYIVHTCIHMHVYAYICIRNTQTCTQMHTHTVTYIHMHVHKCKYIRIHTCAQTCIIHVCSLSQTVHKQSAFVYANTTSSPPPTSTQSLTTRCLGWTLGQFESRRMPFRSKGPSITSACLGLELCLVKPNLFTVGPCGLGYRPFTKLM